MTDKTKALLASLTIYNGNILTVKGCNASFTEMLGFSESQIKHVPLADKLVLCDESSFLNLDDLFNMAMNTPDGVFTSAKMFNNLHYAVSVKLHCVHEENETFKLYFSVLENKSLDPISKLPNGWALSSRINYLLSNEKLTLKNMILIILEADNFSTINYRYDYDIGDQYLVLLGKRLQGMVKGFGFVIRFSNAKYAILIEDYESLPHNILYNRIELICQNLCLELAKPIAISDELQITKSFSIGVTSPGYHYNCYHAMEIAAETEKEKSKKYSINKFFIASSEPAAELLTRKLIIEALPEAIMKNQIEVHYQPQFDMKTRELIGLEALSRWNDDTLGCVPPNIFVGITEDIGLHFEFDLWVFEKVCTQVIAWQHQNIHVPRVAINISFKTMEMTTFIDRIKYILKKTACPTHFIELEVTETSSINNITMLADNMSQVKDLGIHIAIDDFGTGYSSLSLVRTFHLSLDKLKLDRSLVDKVCHTKLDRNFIGHIIELGKILNLTVLAEGVETKEQLDALIELGCDYAQGYYFSKALSCDDIITVMNDRYSTL
ncbi:GGDEF domain-containing phosphodiesterase [uncultured Psychromonas sp.]|uniref:putative bifunctional diguanylate cyclase/phosphodiesterase n=1 Tax=uncultured Psychromonas sp. TaxID=173974 RepID=UPI002633F3F5|nr:GGDEF domain-containing phosphodiesterase [uncultured Psychromonas sp.]